MHTTIHLSGDEDLHIRGGGPDNGVEVEVRNPMADLRFQIDQDKAGPDPAPSCWPRAMFHRRIDKAAARLIASALLAAASAR